MNKASLKTYAPKARRDFIRAMTDRAAVYGLTKDQIEPVTEQGDVTIIAGKPYPTAVAAKRQLLAERVKRDGFDHVMEAMAYTWFNRLVAIRFMELHGYLDHGYRVLSSATDETRMNHGQDRNDLNSHPCSIRVSSVATIPEILLHAEHVDLSGLDKNKVIALKLDGTKEAELYRMLLIAQCNALHSVMPFLFERIDDETELLLPDNLLHSDSLIRQLVNEIDEADWQDVEILGWLYESYISERYAAVIGRVVASEDIPAATQRFTPKWVVRYLVQNTLGRLWLSTYPESPVKGQMRYYIEPAEQTPEVQEQLRAITPTSLNPEEITFLDPACGSAHILVEAYDLFKAIYQERGYRAKDIPRLIVDKNLFGLEIDDRAAQLAGFALMMKARADDRRIFQSGVQPHIQTLLQTDGMDAGDIAAALNVPADQEPPSPPGQLFETDDNLFTRAATAAAATEKVSHVDVAALITLFKDAKTFGSLIQVPPALAAHLPQIEQRTRQIAAQTHAIFSLTAARFLPTIEQAKMLAGHYDCVVANPPYMGNSYYNPGLKQFVNAHFRNGRADLYACFIQRICAFAESTGFVGMITIPNWMFLSSSDALREDLFACSVFESLIHNGRGVFGSDFGSCAFVLRCCNVQRYIGVFRRLFDKQGSVSSNDELEQRFFSARNYLACTADFCSIPTLPVAYWVSAATRQMFGKKTIGEYAFSEGAVKTGNNASYLRFFWEINSGQIGARLKWRKHPKGGGFRRWYGNLDWVVDWSEKARTHYRTDHIARILDEKYWDLPGICWTAVSIGASSFRVLAEDEVANNAALSLFPHETSHLALLLGFLNSRVSDHLLAVCSPTVNYLVGDIQSLPFALASNDVQDRISSVVEQMLSLSREDWNLSETSLGFLRSPLLIDRSSTVCAATDHANAAFRTRFQAMKQLEEENNRLFINAYGLQGELSPEVPDEQITLYHPDREEDIKRLVSYAIGCMMGRYSLDKPGLIYAHSGNVGFDPSQYQTFPADPDGIIPLMETDWFADDAANRFAEFVATAWPGNEQAADETRMKHGQEINNPNPCSIRVSSVANSHLAENLTFVAESLGPTKGEQPAETIRRYLATGFYKHHLQMYKRRPIYWLFSSGKQRAFHCLVYLHRYNESTLSRMRTEYVIPLQGKISARIDQLAEDIAAASSTAFRSKLTKERDKLLKQQAELQAFDEKLRHYADLRISLDLDDGVKVNYGKFGDLLAEVKAVTGGKDDD